MNNRILSRMAFSSIKSKKAALLLALGLCAFANLAEAQTPKADWMSGKWGIGWRINADAKTNIENYNVTNLVSQVQSIGGVEYVIFNLSDAAHGDAYLATNSVLTALNPGSAPTSGRDLFGEMAQGFQDAGIKVIAYMATQGPAMLKHGAEKAYDAVHEGGGVYSSVAMDNWSNYVHTVYGDTTTNTYKQAYAEVIVDEYAERYGTLIDGWWFDHAGLGDIPLLHSTVTAYNTNTVIAFNEGQKVPLTNNNPDYEDFTSGHPTPIATAPANDPINLPMLTSIEGTPDGFFDDAGRKSLGHMFMPMQETWNSGAIVWPLEQAIEWQERALDAGGAWTWNVDTDDLNSQLALPQVALMKAIIAKAVIQENTVFPTEGLIAGQSQQTTDGSLQIMRNEDTLHVGTGQSFTLSSSNTLAAITFQMAEGKNKTLPATGTHEFELWIGSYDDTTVSNHVAGTTNLLTSIDVAGLTFTDSQYYTLNLATPLALPAGDYAFQLYWTTPEQGDHRIWFGHNAAGGYAGGQALNQGGLTGQLPFEEESPNVLGDLVFGLHSATVGVATALSANPESLLINHDFADGSTTGSVDFSYTGSIGTAINITNITIGSESHPGSFSYLASLPLNLTDPDPTNYPVEFVFNNVSNVSHLATATAVATIDWERTGGGESGQVTVPLSAQVIEAVYGKFITVDAFPVFNPTAHTNAVGGSNQRLRHTGTHTTSAGQTFSVPAGSTTTVSRLSVWVNSSESFDNNTHELKLWLGEYDNDTPGAAYAVDLFDMAGASFGSTHLTFDLSSDATLPPGVYAFQLAWTTSNTTHDIVLKRTNGAGDDYAGGARLNNGGAVLPFTSASTADSDLRFSIHSRTDAEWVDMGAAFPTGDDIVASMAVHSNASTLVRNISGLGNRISGQSFNLTEETTLSAITIQTATDESFDNNENHELDLWIVGLDDGLSNNVPLWVDAVVLSSETMTAGNFYQIDFSDITLPAGSYGIEIEWAHEGSSHRLDWRKSDGSVDEYADGYLLHVSGVGATAPFDETANSEDLVFALHKLVVPTGFITWIAGFGLVDGDAAPDFDKDVDGLVNIVEYGLGGDPTNSLDVGTTPLFGAVEDSGTNYFEYIHVKRTDDLSLTYELEQDSDLVAAPVWTNDIPGLIETSGSTADPDFDAVTNRIPTEGKAQEFIRLIIE